MRENGSLVAFETGQVTAYAIASAQERGVLMCKPGDQVYEGQVVGVHQRGGDLKINVCKKKALTNMRASGKDKCDPSFLPSCLRRVLLAKLRTVGPLVIVVRKWLQR